ncbi:MAG: helix-turn-helix domain-containing protein [Actinomycetota bacterium]
MTKQTDQKDPPSWLSVQSAAAELEVTTRTIYRFINDGKLAAYRIGRVYRIKRADLEDFLDGAALQPGDLSHLVHDGRDGEGEAGSSNGG